MLRSQLPNRTTLLTVDTTPSTQDVIASLHQPDRTACIAQQQTQGRGRLGKTWVSPRDNHLFLSYGDHCSLSASKLQGITLAFAVTACEVIESLFHLPKPLSLKWPNDIYYLDKKIGGILLEVEPSQQQSSYLILGIGLNIGTQSCNNQLPEESTSLTAITTSSINTRALTASILAAWQECLQVFETDGLHPFLPRWKARDRLYNQLISYQLNSCQLEGYAHGINEQGLLLISNHHQQQACSPSEISLIRPLV
tara:strand:+ start:851 stop:1609 length:759 start_codon:yes stop_codon:yes gene_type:complete